MTKQEEITPEEVERAQQRWGAGIVAIGEAFSKGKDYVQVAEDHLNTLYAFEAGPVLFKPSKAAETPFRTTLDAALSYFVGGNDAHREDHGFAIHPWSAVRFENVGTYIHGDYAVAMGNYFFTEISGNEVKVEYTFGYFKDGDANLKINLHHSSIPFNAG